MKRLLHWLVVAAIQCTLLSLVFLLWSRVGPRVGLVGLCLWIAAMYWMAERFDRRINREWLDEYERRSGERR